VRRPVSTLELVNLSDTTIIKGPTTVPLPTGIRCEFEATLSD
jgi:hypothetical protein